MFLSVTYLQQNAATVIKFVNFNFSFSQKWEYQYKKRINKAAVTKLKETRLKWLNIKQLKETDCKKDLNFIRWHQYTTRNRCGQDSCKHSTGLARISINIQNENLCSNGQLLKVVNHNLKNLHLRCSLEPWLRLCTNRWIVT